jgi:hypothetical protein
MLCLLARDKLVRSTSFSGNAGFDNGDASGDGDDPSFGGGAGALSLLLLGMRGSNWWRICWSEASRAWFGLGVLGGGEGGDELSESSSSIVDTADG